MADFEHRVWWSVRLFSTDGLQPASSAVTVEPIRSVPVTAVCTLMAAFEVVRETSHRCFQRLDIGMIGKGTTDIVDAEVK